MRHRLRSTLVVVLLASLGVSSLAQDPPQRAGSPGVPVPKRIKMVMPDYPAEALGRGLRGIVILELTIGVDGKVSEARVVRSVPPFDEAAVAAARQWEYEPARVDGTPIPVILTVPITFALKLPELERAPGVPELRQGASPAVPASAGDKPGTVVATVALDDEGFVADAQVKTGDAPWDEALLMALRTWRFAVAPEAPPVAFDITAVFPPSGSKDPVKLRLTDPREAPPLAGPEVAAAAPTPAPSVAPSPAPTTEPPLNVTMTPEAAPSPAAAPEPVAPAAPAATPASPAPAPVPPTPVAPVASPAPLQRDAPTEVLAPAPAPMPAVPVIPVSAVRDVELKMGVPDLSSGRRPLLPPMARIQGVTGEVQVRFSVDSSGAAKVTEVDGPELLQDAAKSMVNSWIFRRTSLERLYMTATVTYAVDGVRAAVAPSRP